MTTEQPHRHHRAGDQPITTDDFTSAARAEGQARIAAMLEVLGTSDDIRAWFPAGFEKGAEWARAHLAAQEPTDAGPHELDDSAPIRNLGYYRSSARCKCGYEVIWGMNEPDAGPDSAWRVHIMRSAVHAARAARRDEEKR